VLDHGRLKVVSASAPGAEILFDGGDKSPWIAAAPASLVVDLGGTEKIDGFVLTPLGDLGHPSGPPAAYGLEQSVDGRAWRSVQSGEFSNIANSRQAQQVRLPTAVSTRFLRFSFPRIATAAPRLAFTELAILRAR
jgi:alpha-L-fucosidase